ncbi:replication protein [Bergeriella denitrificans]|uniref:DNA replication protein gp18 n=1 Tax=Bergeriella denitrificans TaxID=494 RepID=A0A378UKY8_BERDE|nr:replication protein [Bergeriella denitrificans]STZ77363.1 DNA replication protein gp18 [Bergeriella denitrificans]
MSKYIVNAFQVPNAVVDELMWQLSPNAFKLYIMIVRKTTGWGKSSDKISISQFMQYSGIKKRDTVMACLAELEKFNLICPVKRSGMTNEYTLKKLPENMGEPVPKMGTATSPENGDYPKNGTSPEKWTRVVPKMGTATSPENGDTQNPIQNPLDKKSVVDGNFAGENDLAEDQNFAGEKQIAEDRESVAAEAATPAPKKSVAENKKRFEAVVEVFNRVFADCDGVVKVNLQTVPNPKTGRMGYTQTNEKRLKLIPYAWQIAKLRLEAWKDENGLIDGEEPSGKHVLQWFETYFGECLQDPFINGTAERHSHKTWKAGIDYLLRPETLEARVLEK